MKKKLYTIIIACIATMNAFAQYNAYIADDSYLASQQITYGGMMYSSPIYEPFDNTSPSEYHEISSGTSRPGHIRRGFDIPDDPNPGLESPIGDAILPLLVMILTFGAIFYLRRRKANEATR